MILLDTDHLSVLAYPESRQGELLFERLLASPDQSFAMTIVSAEEQMRGWLAEIRRSRDSGKQVRAYDRLLKLIDFWKQWRVLPFDDRAAERFESLRRRRIRIGSQDLRLPRSRWCMRQRSCQPTCATSHRSQTSRSKTGLNSRNVPHPSTGIDAEP